MNEPKMRIGYGVFGRAYEHMFRNDLHHKRSVDHMLLKNMIFLDENSKPCLYKAPQSVTKNIYKHALYDIAQKLKGENRLESIHSAIEFINEIVENMNHHLKKWFSVELN